MNTNIPESQRDLLHKITVAITTEPSLGDKIYGTGIIYNTDKCDYAYLFTVLHNILGERKAKSSTNQYQYNEDNINKITIKLKNDSDESFVSYDLDKKSLIKSESRDFAIFLIDKRIKENTLIEKINQIPNYYIVKNSIKYQLSSLISLGYPGFYKHEKPWGCKAKEAFEKATNPRHYVVKLNDPIEGYDALTNVGGFSGSGFFYEKRAILIGLATSLADNKATTNRVLVRKLNSIFIDQMLQERNPELEKIRIVQKNYKGEQKIGYIKIEGVEMNLNRAIGRVKNDMKDDWFQDSIMYEDILNIDFLSEKLKKYATSKIIYKPDDVLLFSIPKKGYTSRYSMETNLIDRVVYQMLIDYIIDDFDDIIENCVYSYRYDTRDREDKLFVDTIKQWKKMIHQIKYSLENKEEGDENKYLVTTDITHFFDNINIEVLIDILNKCNDIYLDQDEGKRNKYSKVIEILKRVLSKWSINQNGIPQNREPSSFLANIYLVEVDKFMITRGYEYYRYSDDIRIICKNKLEAQKALKDLINSLRELRLNLNASKTMILNLKTDKEEINKHLPNIDIKLEQISSLLAAKKSRDVQIAVEMVVALFKETKEKLTNGSKEDDISSRHLKFCIDRLQRFARQPFLRYKIDEHLTDVVNYIESHLLDQPWFSDLYINFLKALPKNKFTEKDSLASEIRNILIDNKKNLYEWQTYLLWLLLAHHKIEDKELKKYAYRLIDNPNPNSKPSTAGACLYLATIGEPYYISKIKNSIDENKFNDFFTQRNALISVKKFPNISESKISECLKGVHAKLHKSKKIDYYVKPLDDININEIFKDLPDSLTYL